MAEHLLQANKLFCERERRVLFRDLDIALDIGEVLQIEGANGSGKTTLLRVLTGISDTYEGEVLWSGQSIKKVRTEYQLNMHYLGHAAGIKSTLTAEENLRWYAALAGRQLDGTLWEVLAQVGLRGYEDVPCYTLSAGQQRRVNLARLYLLPAKLWILDEPFTAIDKSGVAAIEQLMSHQVKSGGAVIVTTHQDLSSVANVRKVSLG
ncbi:MAG: cytochrome c biogenesis heme-transporting ATPase CcmA [Pseudomonadales bacterium]|nr:cytochrome c biogenesis heme-transporting ATPase CcmA [Pseudomonadales bacterium]MCP5213937.1 cytochrome c biogenesis heme-transporting ATPase CcmA [Pseudomonadales bacterium]MCP5302853.1 cytochrome c biogenesis heme-transporting ATPase CcmA [Pseudomonadales bacterium]